MNGLFNKNLPCAQGMSLPSRLFLFFLSLGIMPVIFFEPMYHWSIGWFGVEKLTGYGADTPKMNYHELIDI